MSELRSSTGDLARAADEHPPLDHERHRPTGDLMSPAPEHRRAADGHRSPASEHRSPTDDRLFGTDGHLSADGEVEIERRAAKPPSRQENSLGGFAA
jgi:hypothetical protein